MHVAPETLTTPESAEPTLPLLGAHRLTIRLRDRQTTLAALPGTTFAPATVPAPPSLDTLTAISLQGLLDLFFDPDIVPSLGAFCMLHADGSLGAAGRADTCVGPLDPGTAHSRPLAPLQSTPPLTG